ncbi:MAG: Ser-Thr-rich GPI-anchored membrane family protein, partial [Arenicellales bacterium]
MPEAIRSLSARPYLLFFAVLVTVTALLIGTTESFSASSLKVISPNGGQSYVVGSSLKIKWAKGNGGAKVKVTLLKGGKGYLAISKKTKNDGKLTWKIPSKVKAGGNYKIKIQSLSDTKVSDTSNKSFKITKAKSTKTAALKVTKPNGGKTYKTGQKMAILWVKGNAGAYVKITLLKGKKAYKVVSKKTKNDGKFTYTIPATIKAGKAYKIKISSTKDAKISDTSDKAFTI